MFTKRIGSLAALTLRQAKRLILFVVGTTVVVIGIVMLVTPGPAIVVIPAGLGILALEFAWARRLLRRIKVELRLAKRRKRLATEAKKQATRSSHEAKSG